MEDLHHKLNREELMREVDRRVITEIVGLKEALIRTDMDETQSLDDITEYSKRISDVLQTISDHTLDVQNFSKQYKSPILELLSAGPLIRTEVPINTLVKLISVGYHVNECSSHYGTCLDVAVKNQHYNAIKLLLQHGAKSYDDFVQPPIVVLAAQSNAPFDLFDLLATPGNLNDSSQCYYLPLHKAVCCGNTKIALHLIKLGASVNQRDGLKRLPVDYIMKLCTDQFNSELFFALLPSRGHGEDILKPISTLFSLTEKPDKTSTHLFEMLHQLLQRLHFDGPVNVKITCQGFNKRISVNGVVIVSMTVFRSIKLLHVYLCSLLLVALEFDLTSVPNRIEKSLPSNVGTEELTYACVVDDVFEDYRKQGRVKCLLRLCILQIRSCMTSLDDDSFLRLPVPPYIRGLLTYRDVAEKIFVEWCERSNFWA